MNRKLKVAILLASTLLASNLQAAPQSVKAKASALSTSPRAALQSGLMKAIATHNLPQIKTWLSRGAQINLPNKNGTTPFMEAVAVGITKSKTDVIQLFLSKGANVQARKNGGFSVLHVAAMMGNIEITKMLVDKGAKINVADKGGTTPLMMASISPFKETEKTAILLVSRGANINAKDSNNGTPIYMAATKGKNDLVKLLLSKGANVNAADKQGMTPLNMAACSDHPQTVQTLIDAGAKIDEVNIFGDTALTNAIQWDSFASAKVLLKNGANPLTWNASGDTPLSLAEAKKHAEIIALLKAAPKEKGLS